MRIYNSHATSCDYEWNIHCDRSVRVAARLGQRPIRNLLKICAYLCVWLARCMPVYRDVRVTEITIRTYWSDWISLETPAMRPRISEEYSQQQCPSKLCLSTILYSTTCCSQPVTTSSRIDTFVVTRVTSSGLPGQDLTIRWGIRLSRGQTKCQGLINPFRRQFNYLCNGICPSHEINTAYRGR